MSSEPVGARDDVLVDDVDGADDDVRDVFIGEMDFAEYRLLVAGVSGVSAKAAVASQNSAAPDDAREEAYGDYKSTTEFVLALLKAEPDWGRRILLDDDALAIARLPDDVEDAIGIEKVGGEYVDATDDRDAVDIPIGGNDDGE